MGKRQSDSKELKREPELSQLVLDYVSKDAIRLDGFNDCIIGVGEQNANGCSVFIYDAQAIVDAMMSEWRLTLEESEEYFSHNILGCFNGMEGAPIFQYFRIKKGDVIQQGTYEEK